MIALHWRLEGGFTLGGARALSIARYNPLLNELVRMEKFSESCVLDLIYSVKWWVSDEDKVHDLTQIPTVQYKLTTNDYRQS